MSDNKNNSIENKSKGPQWLRYLKSLASLKLTVICLVVLTVLVIWGTVYQAEHGLYQAQQKFFHSWLFFIFGFIPFPGTVAVMFVLFVNLVFSLIFRIKLKLANIGNIVTHLGIIILLVGGFITFYFTQESTLMLKEGEESRWSTSHREWEIALWQETGADKDVYAMDTNHLSPGDRLSFDDLGIDLKVVEYYGNCTALSGGMLPNSTAPSNASGITLLKEKQMFSEMEQNVAGIVFEVTPEGNSQAKAKVLLYGQEDIPTLVTVDGKNFGFSLRKKRLPLPISVYLQDFKAVMYPNSSIPKSYESKVVIREDGAVEREVIISMNKPLRTRNYTFFQSSYYIEPNGTEYSILAVVQNSGRLLPYISSIVIFSGMLIHFLVMLMRRRKKKGEG